MNKHFYLRLNPSRPTFAQDMTQEERTIMQAHVAYWTALKDKGIALVFGPVIDPKGVYGVGIVAADNEQQIDEFIANDPGATINTYEFYPMRAIVADRFNEQKSTANSSAS